jgi:class 3 adenylate cyclase
VSVVLWLSAGLILPNTTDIPAGVSTPIVVLMAVANLVAATIIGRTRTLDAAATVLAAMNLITGIAIVVLASETARFDRYAGPAVILQFTFAFLSARRFLLTLVVAIVEVGLLAVAAAARGVPGGYAVDLFIVVSALSVGVGVTYVLESTARTGWAQRRVIAALHEQVDRLFHQYLSPDVASALLSDPELAELGGEVVEVSVLFADLQGFTPFSEGTPPARVVALLNDYFEAIVPIIFREGGTIVQFAGDAVMAIFNAPVRQSNHALHAARAALGIQGSVDAIAGTDAGRPRFRAGVSTGPSLVGNVGSRAMRNFTAIGDTPNLASRLQTFAQPGQVVISERTYELIGGAARVRLLGTPELKGKSERISVYELLALDVEAPRAAETAETAATGV